MAKIVTKSEKFIPFGGIFSNHKGVGFSLLSKKIPVINKKDFHYK